MQAQMRQMQEAHENEIAQMNERDKAHDTEIAQMLQTIECLVQSSLTRNQFVAQRTDGQDIPNTAFPQGLMAKSSVANRPGDVS
jgi:hypothetical protein